MNLQTKETDLIQQGNALIAEAAKLAALEDPTGEDIEKFHKLTAEVKAVRDRVSAMRDLESAKAAFERPVPKVERAGGFKSLGEFARRIDARS